MTTSSDTNPDPRDGVERKDWEDDVVAETKVEKEYGPDGEESVYYYILQDTAERFQNAWISSTRSVDLRKMN